MVSCMPHDSKDHEMTPAQDIEFQKLLQAWNRHQDLRKNGGAIASLVDSRAELDRARQQLALAA